MKKRDSFTLIEMLVTVAIVAFMVVISTLSFGSGKSSETVADESNVLKGLVDELKSYAAGQDRDRASHYVLIIKTNASVPPPGSDTLTSYCTKSGAGNGLMKNQYMICESDVKDISSLNLTSDLNRVRAGSFNKDLTITSSGFDTTNPLVINIRASDGQVGYDKKYCDADTTHCGTPTISLDQSGQKEMLTLSSIAGTLK